MKSVLICLQEICQSQLESRDQMTCNLVVPSTIRGIHVDDVRMDVMREISVSCDKPESRFQVVFIGLRLFYKNAPSFNQHNSIDFHRISLKHKPIDSPLNTL